MRGNVKIERGYPILKVEIEGQPAQIGIEQKLADEGLIFAGSEFEEVLAPQEIPAKPEIGRQATTLYGFTDDPEVVKLYRLFRLLDEAGRLEEGPIEV